MKNLDYTILFIYTIILALSTISFSQNIFLARVQSFDDWLLSQHLQKLFINTLQMNFFEFFKGLFDLSYGPVFWLPLYLITLPFFILDYQPGIIVAGRLFSLICGIVSWILVIKLIRKFVTKNQLIICASIFLPIFTSIVLHFQTSLHPETCSVFWLVLTIYFLTNDYDQPKKFSFYFNYALAAFSLGLATKLTITPLIGAFIFHLLINKKQYSTHLLKKHVLFFFTLMGILHFPLFSVDILKHYATRLYVLFQASRQFNGWGKHLEVVFIKIENYGSQYFSLFFFIGTSFIATVLITKYFINKKTLTTRLYLVFINSFYFIFFSIWVMATNFGVLPNYGIAAPYCVPIIIAFILTPKIVINNWNRPLVFLFCLLWNKEAYSKCKQAFDFFSLKNSAETHAYHKLLSTINDRTKAQYYPYTVVGASPSLGMSTKSTYSYLTVHNIRTTNHFKDLSNLEAIILEKNFTFHDKPEIDLITFMHQQNYMHLFTKIYNDNHIIIFLRKDLAQTISTTKLV